MNSNDVRRGVDRISRRMACEREALCALDAQSGDGDLGVSMNDGFAAVQNWLVKTTETDLGRLLLGMSGAFNEAAPSSLGTILSLGMAGMARALKGKTQCDPGELAAAMRRGLDVMMERGGARPGEKTVLDALCPAVEALECHASEGLTQALAGAAVAAGEGAERTRGMTPRHGRAAYYGEKNLGRLDGGAVAGQLIFEALAAKDEAED